MNQLSDKDIELAKKHGVLSGYVVSGQIFFTFSPENLAALFAERDAEQQPHVESSPLDSLDWERLKSGDCRALNPDNQWAFNERKPNAEAYAYAVYFPDEPTEVLCHNLDELIDDLTNRQHEVTKLFTHAPRPDNPCPITRERLIEIQYGARVPIEQSSAEAIADAILAELNQAQETKP